MGFKKNMSLVVVVLTLAGVCRAASILTNCILWDGGDEIAGTSANTLNRIQVTYTNVHGGWPGTGNIDVDPLFVAPDSNGHLLPDSPCIDAGDPNFVAKPNKTDIDGNPRIANGIVDMGAYEFFINDPIKLLDVLADDVTGLELHQGIENSLLTKIGMAIDKLENNNEKNVNVVTNSLQAFINAVEAQRGKKLSEEDADDLIVTAQKIIDMLSNE